MVPTKPSIGLFELPKVSNHGINDIDALELPSKSGEEIIHTMNDLSNSEKYQLLCHHVPPLSGPPSTYGCSRKFNIAWLSKYAWLKYSPKLDGVFCGSCAVLLTSSRQDKGVLVNRPFSQWVKLSETLSKHAKLAYHHEALQAADILKSSIGNPNSRIDVMSSHVLRTRILENKHISAKLSGLLFI